jgi:hypothetical protein
LQEPFGEHRAGSRTVRERGTPDQRFRFRGMVTGVQFEKGRRWRNRAAQLRALAEATEEAAVRDNLLATAEAFENYARKWDGTALVFRFAPRSRETLADARTRKAS